MGVAVGCRTLQGMWSHQQASRHVNLLEMEAVLLSVARSLPQLKSRVVHLMRHTSTRKVGSNCSEWHAWRFISSSFVTRRASGSSQFTVLVPATSRPMLCCMWARPWWQSRPSTGNFSIQCSPHGEHQWSICRDFYQQEAACLRITIPRPEGQICGCYVSSWSGMGMV